MKIAMLFPGYGSQFVGMAKELYDESRIMQEYFEEAANCLDINFVKLVFASSDAELARMENAYPSLFLVSGALAAVLKEQGIVPDMVAGYGIGEFGAAHAAGGLSLPDGLYILAKYASLYQTLLETTPAEGLHITGIPAKKVEEMCRTASRGDQRVYVGVIKGDADVIVLGDPRAIEAMRELASEHDGVKLSQADVELGLHSGLMDPVVVQVKMYLEKIDFKDIPIPLLTNSDAQPVQQGDALKTAAIKQVHSPILWAEIVKELEPYDLIIEVGPGSQLCSMLRMVYPTKSCISINKKTDIEEVKRLMEQQIVEQAQ